ncbi:hypothetical protein [Nocardia sp. NPDC004260]
MTNPLPPLVYGKVVGRLLATTIDSADIGAIPDFPPLTGRITFQAAVPKFLVDGDPPATVVPLIHPYYTAVLDEQGYLSWRGERGVMLPAPVAGTMNPSDWTWRVSFDLEYDGVPVKIAPYNIEVPEYIPGPDEEDPDTGSVGLVDLALASPVPSSTGDAVTRGLSVVSVGLDGNALVFGLDDGSFLPGVEVPAIQDALDAADAAADSETAAAASATAAQNAVNSFDLDIGTVTTGAAGSSASASVGGGPPAWTLNLTIPRGDTGATGTAPDATSSVKGIVRLPGSTPGELGGTANNPTVTGWSGKSDVGHTHVATDISNSTATGRSVLTAVDAAAARTAIGAGTSSLTLGTTGSTAAAGNDARLSDTRTPSANTVPCDFMFVAVSPSATRATGAGDWTVGMYVGRAFTLTKCVYQFETADASGSTSAEIRRNGSTVTSSGVTVTAANQADGTSTDAARTSTPNQSFAVGDRLGVQITAVGTTPGKGLKVYLFGTWN